MVDSGQSDIRSVSFASRDRPGVPVEVLHRADLFDRLSLASFDRADRPSFDGFLLINEGEGDHTVDFEQISLKPGRLVRTRPGQVQTWDTENRIDATLILAEGTPHARSSWFPGHTAYCDLGVESLSTARSVIDALRIEQDRFKNDEPSTRLLTSLFGALVALFDRAQESHARTDLPEPYLVFRTAIEFDLGQSHNVRDYIADIGYSERTVSRACQRVTGLTAKGVLNQRLVLEAKRLLAHTDKPASTIAAELGFTEATNFHKFFTRHTTQRPIEFRNLGRAAAVANR